jgi:dienelactone hydrolase
MHENLFGGVLLASVVLTAAASLLFAEPTTSPTTKPSTAGTGPNGWDGSWFNYTPAKLVVEETTPTRAQIDWRQPPAKLPANLLAPTAPTTPVKPLAYEHMNLTHLRFRDQDGADVPALLVTPRDKQGPFPVVVALHGLRSHKAQVVAQVAPTLVKRGFAVLAPDLPLHGERPGNPGAMFDQKDLRAFVARARQAIVDVRLCIDLAEQRPELDTKNGVILVGYSMGALFNSVVGPADPRVKAMCLMVGGTVDFPPMMAMVPQFAALQPQLAIPHFAGRPLLMLNGTQDHVITREMTERLYAAAPEPKQQVWYESGHLLPDAAYDQCAKWVAETWKTIQAAPR